VKFYCVQCERMVSVKKCAGERIREKDGKEERVGYLCLKCVEKNEAKTKHREEGLRV